MLAMWRRVNIRPSLSRERSPDVYGRAGAMRCPPPRERRVKGAARIVHERATTTSPLMEGGRRRVLSWTDGEGSHTGTIDAIGLAIDGIDS
jgi:hypothetical protein